MIKCKLDNKKKYVKIKAQGTPGELAKDTMVLIMLNYEQLKIKNPEAADEYKKLLQAAIIDPKSPLFK